MNNIRPIAIYLPQFHPTPENDEWWGKGFTEWTNVTKAKPLFKNHYQPQLPTDLGFYDLRLEEARLQQEALAKEYGIEGFCYYHYWFNGKRILHEPLDRKLKNSKEDLPFMLCWANETWSRRWLGEEKEVLIKQEYSEDDDIIHIKWMIDIFKDKRYITINNRPAYVIYRPLDLPDIKKTLTVWRTACIDAGLENPYFIASNSHTGQLDLREYGFDAILNFEPQLGVLDDFSSDKRSFSKFIRNIKLGVLSSRLKIYDYSYAKSKMAKRKFSYPYLPCSFVSWDNSARRGRNGIIIKNTNPKIFEKFLLEEISKLKDRNPNNDVETLFFINAWNEWAEGNHLEPCIKFGHNYLNAVKSAIKN